LPPAYLLVLAEIFFDPEDGGDIFLRNVGCNSTDYTASLSTCVLAVFAEPISSTLKMEALCSSETSVSTQLTTRRHIPEDNTLHNHRCENFKSYMCQIGWNATQQ
jgi:hypothetical protein